MNIYLHNGLVGIGQDLFGKLLFQMDLSVLTNDILPACQQLGVYHHIRLIDHNAFALAKAEKQIK